jgi:hypothetical protein
MELRPYLNDKTGSLRFTVPVSGDHVMAYLTETSWRARFGTDFSDSSFMDVYNANKDLIDRAVTRRVAAGAREPVVLRVADL